MVEDAVSSDDGDRCSSALVSEVLNFDVGNARCFTDHDTRRLHEVIETIGHARISALVRDVFIAEVPGRPRLSEHVRCDLVHEGPVPSGVGDSAVPWESYSD